MRRYRKLKVWDKAAALALRVYDCTTSFPKTEIYGLSAQLRRAAISVPSNIAEGSERRSDKDFIRFLRLSAGSLAELETQLYLALKLGYIDESHYSHLTDECYEVGKMINGLCAGLSSAEAEEKTLLTTDC